MLRVLEISDASDLRDLLGRNRDLMLPWIPWAAEEPTPVEKKVEKIVEWKTEFLCDQKYIYGVYDDKGEMAGLIFLFTRQGPGKLEIGYIIDKDHTGKGYATEASYALTKLGFESLKIPEMVIHCSVNNLASAKIPEKLGYEISERKKEGENEMLIWSQFKDSFKPLQEFEEVEFLEEKINLEA